MQNALLGAVPECLRAVTCAWQGTNIKLRFLFHGQIAESDYEDAQIVGTEVISEFDQSWTIEEEILRLDYPADVRPYALDHWAYLRKELSQRALLH